MKHSLKWMSNKNWASIFFVHLHIFSIGYGIQILARLLAMILISKAATDDSVTYKSFAYGFSQDIAVACYYWLFLSVIMLLADVLNFKYSPKIKMISWVAINLYFLFVVLADLALLYLWGSHVNTQALVYFQYPKQLLISVPTWLLVMILCFFVLSGWILLKWIPKELTLRKGNSRKAPIFYWLTCLALAVIGIRGGLGKVPIQVASSQKSKNEGVNLLSLNSIWNANYYLFSAPNYPAYQHLIQTNPSEKYREGIFGGNISHLDSSYRGVVLPKNIIFISMEGIGAAVSDLFGGTHFNGLPHLDSWCKRSGWYFDRAFATGDRTDKGIASLYSAWPGQPWEGILHEPNRSKNLPHLGKALSSNHIRTYFFYGGDANFANIRYYMQQGGIEHIYDASNIHLNASKGNWGYHDGDMLPYMRKIIKTDTNRYFAGIMLLSSHEPYDVVKSHTSNDIEAFYQSVNYVDACIHDFLTDCWKDPFFDDTWFVITSDHGKYLQTPETQAGQPEFFRVPLCIIGKSLRGKSQKVSTTVSQTDLFNTILQLYQISPAEIKYSRSILQHKHPNRAWFQLFEVGGLIQGNKVSWLSTNLELLKREMPFNTTDSAILTLESEIISDFFNLK